MHKIDRETFGALLVEAVTALPEVFRERIENASFIVEEAAIQTTSDAPAPPAARALPRGPADPPYVRLQPHDA